MFEGEDTILDIDISDELSEDELMHYGTKYHSGRYPWGSGENPYQHSGTWKSRYDEMRKQGMNDSEIAKALHMSPTELNAAKSIASNMIRNEKIARAQYLVNEKGYSKAEAGRIMGVNESSIRGFLEQGEKSKQNVVVATTDFLIDQVDSKGMIMVGHGAELEASAAMNLGISKTRLETAIVAAEMRGYKYYKVRQEQMTNPGKFTTVSVLCPPGTEYKDVYAAMKVEGGIKSIEEYSSPDGGYSFKTFEYPTSVSSDRIGVRYLDENGEQPLDGVIELRRGVKDLSLGSSAYAQVRIAVDGTHYIKGIALYSDDLPDGVDILVNANKKPGTPLLSDNKDAKQVLKPMKTDDPNNPFGSYIKADGQSYYEDPHGKYTDPVTGKKVSLSAINKIREEGDWSAYSKKLPSQFLGKQDTSLIERQLNLTYANSLDEFNDICSLTNPTVKKKRLEDFADECESNAVYLKAASLPGQTTKLLLPVTSLKDDECYCPTYSDGTKLALVRYPHAGTFEIPIVTVNNKNKEGLSRIGNSAIDAIGINSNVANRLSGADFDGDTVTAIPISKTSNITSTPSLEGLKGFDPKVSYGTEAIVDAKGRTNYYRNGVKIKVMTNTNQEMGKISNLITDMTIQGADSKELARAVRHSMVVIDAEKHKLDYKQSYKDNNIAELKSRYQKGGASTLLSKAKSPAWAPKEKDFFYSASTIDPNTGEKIITLSPDRKKKKLPDGTYITTDEPKKEKKPLMLRTKDARDLSTGSKVEELYANYANQQKALANQARKEWLSTREEKKDPIAAKTYAPEVASLSAKLNKANKNAPKEVQAQLLANARVEAMKKESDMDKEELRKAKNMALARARAEVGASGKETRIHITDKEWEAIQARAISSTTLRQILVKADDKEIVKLATPKKASLELSEAKQNRIQAMRRTGATIADIAEQLGIAKSTVEKYIK